MTVFFAYEQTDLDSVNLNYWYGATNADQELNEDTPGSDFQFDYHLLTTGNDILSLYGSDFAYNGETFISEGFLQDLIQWAWNGTDAYDMRWLWEDWNIPLYFFWEAGQTEDTADDFAVLALALRGADTFHMSAEDDSMRGFKGPDVMYGYAGNDELRGSNGKDTLYGNAGDDTLRGGDGKDKLYGGAGDDLLSGGIGDDKLRGGPGRDQIYGGEDEDVFEFRAGDEKDIIRDFELGIDKIDLSDFGFDLTWQEFKQTYVRRDGDFDEDTRIDLGGGDVIVLRDVTKSDLDANDFIF